MPQGGGALRGIGETFRANPATGSLSASIPLPLTPLPRGLVPSLALSYDSGGGNSPFGHGWSLGAGEITRRTDKRLPEYLDREDSDELLFGGEVLVPVIADGVRDVSTVTEGATSYTVERFRPRIEGGFTRVERWTKTSDAADVHWRTHAADNTRSKYGTSTASRIGDPAAPWRIFSWLIDETRDDRGHVVTFTYKAETLDGVSFASPSEAHRQGTTQPQRYLKRVRYGATTPGDAGSCAIDVVFDYGEHDADAPTPTDTGTWALRQDPFSSCRAGFEVRTYRLCQRVLVFHTFASLGTSPQLVKSLDLAHSASPKLTQLSSAKVVGYIPDGSGGYDAEELPAVSFGYTEAPFTKAIQTTPAEELGDWNPMTLNQSSQWVDLDGEGIPGVLQDRGRSLHYKPNDGAGKLGFARALALGPNLRLTLSGGAAQLQDVAGSGTMAVVRADARQPGYHLRTREGWAPFRPFKSVPHVDWKSPNLRLVDLNGDGFDDILMTQGDHFLWYPSLGKDGWGKARRVPVPKDRFENPAIIFAGRNSTIYLADMSGDGLADLVRVQFSRVSYWPNLGHGRFGHEVVMGQSPVLGSRETFHPARVRLADLDGTGTADLVYFDEDGMHVFENRAGNSFGARLTNECVPTVAALRTLSFVDFHGIGMSTAVWFPQRGLNPPVTLRRTSPFGTQKPYLLASIDNGSGLETRFEHTPSTVFYLADKKAGKPWATKLPFPVQCLSKVESYDRIAKARLVSTTSYHHGHYDTVEREFCGFGRVEQRDAETFAPGQGAGLFPDLPLAENGELPQAPVLTKTWFHTGAWLESRGALDAAFAEERWTGDSAAPAPLSCSVPSGLSAEDLREAHRALKGTMLRQEVYGLDGSALEGTPFSVHETSAAVKLLQPIAPARGAERPKLHAVLQVLPREVRDHTYDRIEDDPRVTQWAALAHDTSYGFVTTSASVAYARRGTPLAAAEAEAPLAGLGTSPTPLGEQARVHCVVTDTALTHVTDFSGLGYRLAVPTASTSYELTGLTGSSPLEVETLTSNFTSASDLGYHQAPTSGLQRRLVDKTKIRYFDSTNLSGTPLAFGSADARALPYESYRLDTTDALLTALAVTDKITSSLLSEGGYVTPSGESGYWIRSGRPTLDGAAFFVTTEATDPFGNVTAITYDDETLLVTEIEDALTNTIAATHDYRVLALAELTDPNGNRQQAKYDALGRIAALALMGKTSESLGDTLSNPTQEFLYQTDRWTSAEKPNYTRTRARREHGGTPTWQESYVYTDGSGRVAMTKVMAEPGDAPELDSNGDPVRDTNGDVVLAAASPRWVGTGRTLVNNKGNPVKQYEPYFSATSEYEDDDDLVKWGVTPILHYDALGRLIRTDLPHGSYRKVEHGVWKVTSWDENDTLSDTTNEWRLARASLSTSDPERVAYDQAVLHADTPSRAYFDPLGRPFLAIAHNKQGSTDQYLATRTRLDIEGRALEVKDPLLRVCQTYAYSIASQLLTESNIDSGARWHFADVSGAFLRKWDARAQRFRPQYDVLRRPTHLFMQPGSATEVLLQRTYYGDDAGISSPETNNLRGKAVRVFDGAGRTKSESWDFKGNPLVSDRKLATTYTSTPDWSALASVTSVATADSTASSSLESETFSETRVYDALNRITSLTTPDSSEYLPTFNEASLLEAVDVKVRGSSTATSFVKGISYDAKGQRTAIDYSKDGSGDARFGTTYAYDPLTFRLKRLITTRVSPSNTLQDLSYTFDAVGNVVRIKDQAQQTVFYDNSVVLPENVFVYDAVGRLLSATGREHASVGDVQVDHNDQPIRALPDPNSPNAIRNYSEEFEYDEIGNLLEMFHDSGAVSWTRTYSYTTGTNQLASHTAPGGSVSFTYNEHGSMDAMPHLSTVEWDAFEQMQHASNGTQDTYFTYGADGTRVRKVYDTNANLIKQRIYLGAYEIYRETVSSTVQLERQTLHVNDGVKRIAMVETKTINGGSTVSAPDEMKRFQLGNHLGSAMLELDETGLVISHEEYAPYGASTYRSARSAVDVSARRYRYIGKEHDDETGLYSMGARYYAAWLGRWTSADPMGIGADGPGLYNYTRGSPIGLVDPSGHEGVSPLQHMDSCTIEDAQRGQQLQGHLEVQYARKKAVAEGGSENDAYNAAKSTTRRLVKAEHALKDWEAKAGAWKAQTPQGQASLAQSERAFRDRVREREKFTNEEAGQKAVLLANIVLMLLPTPKVGVGARVAGAELPAAMRGSTATDGLTILEGGVGSSAGLRVPRSVGAAAAEEASTGEALYNSLSDDVKYRVLARDLKGRPFGSPANPRVPSAEELNANVLDVPASELKKMFTDTKHDLFPPQLERVRKLPNEELLELRLADPISVGHTPTGGLLTGGHHRTAVILERLETGELSPDEIVKVLFHD